MYRAAFTYTTWPWPQWDCVKCWPVVDEFASKAVDIDRRTQTRKKLRLLSQNPVPLGPADPRKILDEYLFSLPVEVKEARR